MFFIYLEKKVFIENYFKEFLTDSEFIFFNGWIWAYAIGFAGPFWIGVGKQTRGGFGGTFF